MSDVVHTYNTFTLLLLYVVFFYHTRIQIYITYCVPRFKNTRNKYFTEKFQNCPPNASEKISKFTFKN